MIKQLISKVIDRIYQFFFPVQYTLDNSFKQAAQEFMKLDETIRKTMKLLSQNEIKDLGKLENLKRQSEE
jgi:hypothetical protein